MLNASRKTLVFAAGLAVSASLACTTAPEGWSLDGSKPANYDTGVDQKTLYNAHASAYLTAKSDSEGFGTLDQGFKAAQYVGKRLRFSALVKSEGVTRWAGMWMRIDGPSDQVLGFDNMEDRAIKGTIGWQKYGVVLDVKEKATLVAFGILLDGPGEVWMNSANIEVVDSSVPTTGEAVVSDGPTNLRFDPLGAITRIISQHVLSNRPTNLSFDR